MQNLTIENKRSTLTPENLGIVCNTITITPYSKFVLNDTIGNKLLQIDLNSGHFEVFNCTGAEAAREFTEWMNHYFKSNFISTRLQRTIKELLETTELPEKYKKKLKEFV